MPSWAREPTRLTGEWSVYRQVAAGYPPLWHPGSARRPTEQPSARWHTAGHGLAQYFAFEPDGAWAELVRYEGIRTEPDRVSAGFRRTLWKCWVTDADVADLGTFDEIHRLGLHPALVIDDDHTACRALAAELHAAGFSGLITPSAAIASVQNLTMFGPRREIQRRAMSGWNPNPSVFVPVSLIADDAAPPGHVLDLVRHFGDPHLGFAAWVPPSLPTRSVP